MSAPRIEFFFDLSSPWTYLAFTNIQKRAACVDADIIWRPFLVGGVFNAVNPALYAARENMDSPRMKHSGKILKDWAAWSGLALDFPSPHHPAKSVNAMRMACVLEEEQVALHAFATAAFEAYFLRAENLDDPEVLVAAANSVGLDGAALRDASTTDANKAKLRANTDEVIARGGFGSPSIFVDKDDLYFGNDQLPLVEFALKGKHS
jgi:2-hydroxychromene-2-carboxylate isomerase